jgi:hypothetical protein
MYSNCQGLRREVVGIGLGSEPEEVVTGLRLRSAMMLFNGKKVLSAWRTKCSDPNARG